MSKQMTIVEVPVTDKERRAELQLERLTFVTLLMILTKEGAEGLYKFLKEQSSEAVMDYAKAWDSQKHVPIGYIFSRPEFEVIAATKTQKGS